ncbi:hypothetical protein BX666DRAFT_2027698 [Dichotomocladium elegans]|nr:hypothetical protein BX666DRAFT_2027698 [Dichotomocladium elegans]
MSTSTSHPSEPINNIDQFVHALIRDGGATKETVLVFASVVHKLLVNTASYITHFALITCSRLAGFKIRRLVSRKYDHVLFSNRAISVDHVKLSKAVKQSGQ